MVLQVELVTLWETKEDMEATAKGSFIENAIALVTPYQKKRPTFTGYQVHAREVRTVAAVGATVDFHSLLAHILGWDSGWDIP